MKNDEKPPRPRHSRGEKIPIKLPGIESAVVVPRDRSITKIPHPHVVDLSFPQEISC